MQRLGRNIVTDYELYLFLLPALVYIVIFAYVPMYGMQIAFKKFTIGKGIWGSPWVGFEHFIRFFNNYQFPRLIRNTLTLSLYRIIFSFPAPIILALMLNYVRNLAVKKFVQTVTYAPYFISSVAMAGMIIIFLNFDNGLVPNIVRLFGGAPKRYMMEPGYFKPIYVLTDIWQLTGYSSILYLAALSSVDKNLYEAATIDGATKLQRIWHIDLPAIRPTIVIMLILTMGTLMNVGFDKAFLLQNNLNIDSADVINTYVYRIGMGQAVVGGGTASSLGPQYSYAAAIGMFNNVINCIMLVLANFVAGKVGETSLW